MLFSFVKVWMYVVGVDIVSITLLSVTESNDISDRFHFLYFTLINASLTPFNGNISNSNHQKIRVDNRLKSARIRLKTLSFVKNGWAVNIFLIHKVRNY